MLHDNGSWLKWIYALQYLGRSIAHESPALVQQRLLEHIVSGFRAATGSISLAADDGSGLTLTVGTGNVASFVGKKIAFGEGVLGWVAQHRQPLLLNGDAANDPRFVSSRPDPRSRPSSAMCWPLLVENRLLGVLSINGSPERPPFTETDLAEGTPLIGLVSLVVERIRMHLAQQRHIAELHESRQLLEEAQQQLVQSEKMASIGQLAAGVAHEINNPVGYINSNLQSLQRYLEDILAIIAEYQRCECDLSSTNRALIHQVKSRLDLDFLYKDVRNLVSESQEGISRVRKIVQDLKDFSRVDDAEWQWTDLHKCMDSTLNIANNEIKYKAEVIKEYGDLPLVECVPSQINQVFLNLLVNAAHAIETNGTITLRSRTEGDCACFEISDTGCGIEPEHLERIFDPFFTTKPVGKGTGLGLWVTYGIVNKHKGRIAVQSRIGKGTTFQILLPVRQSQPKADKGHAALVSAA